MPSVKKVETKEATAAGCVLRLGKTNNVVAWNEELKSTVSVVIFRLDDPFGDNIKTISVRIVVALCIRFTYGFKT